MLAAGCDQSLVSIKPFDPTAAPDHPGGPADTGPPTLELPQLIHGAAFVDPEVYPALDLRVVIAAGRADTVDVAIDGGRVVVATGDGALFTAHLDVAALADGSHTLTVRGLVGGRPQATAEGELVAGREGMAITTFTEVGRAATPRLFLDGDALLLTWCDRRDGDSKAWAAHLDGAGRFLDGPTLLFEAPGDEVLSVRAAVHDRVIGVLDQGHGGPYASHLRAVSFDGEELLAPIALDPADRFGSYGGDIAVDGSAFVAVWRTNDGAGTSDVRWARFDETGLLAGPVVVATSSLERPIDPISEVKVAVVDGRAMVVFVRGEFDQALEMSIPAAQGVVLDAEGGLVVSGRFSDSSGFPWDTEARVFAMKDAPVVLFGSKSLLDDSDNPPVSFFGGPAVMAAGGPGHPRATIEAGPGDRQEPFLLPLAAGGGVLAWTDLRSYEDDLLTGRIELFVADVDADLTTAAPVVFPHARFIASTADLHAVERSGNAVVSWIDERHGGSILDPRPEIRLETAWR